ncbi:MAG TPA: GntR family transcriptional regulator [Acidimicrobiales bacterium]
MALRTESESAAQRVYEWTRSRILDGTFAGGTLLSEGEVAEAVSVSRTPVREAFLQLAAENMLELFPKRGALVVSVSMTELREVLIARSVIEPWAAATVAKRADRVDTVAALRKLIANIAAMQTRGDDRLFQEADREFHQYLIAAAGNGLFTGFYSSLRDRQLRGGSLALKNNAGREIEIMAQHVTIVDAIERGDFETAATAISSHVDATALELGLAPIV